MHRNVASLESLIYQEISNSYQTFWIVLSDIFNVWNLFTTNSKRTFFIITRKNSEFLNKKGAKLTSPCETLLKKIFGANINGVRRSQKCFISKLQGASIIFQDWSNWSRTGNRQSAVKLVFGKSFICSCPMTSSKRTRSSD